MLHAFRDCDGREIWGFIPPQVLPHLKDTVTGTHQYFVDSPPVAYVHDSDNDGIIESAAPENDKVVLMFGLRRGGSSDDISYSGPWGGYFAINVSVPTSPKLLFSVDSSTTDSGNSTNLAEMGQSWSQPRLGKIRHAGNVKVVAFVTGGYDKNEDLRYGQNQNFPDASSDPIVLPQLNDGGLDSGAGKTSSGTTAPDSRYNPRGRAMYAIEVAYLDDASGSFVPNFDNAGNILWEYDTDNNSDLDYSIASDMTVGDLNGDGFSDTIYVGDTGGRMWRFRSPTLYSPEVNTFTGNIIFDANPGYAADGSLISGDVGRKIFYKPAVSVINGKVNLWFGTGDRAHPLNHAVVDRIYQVVDKGQVTSDAINEARLVDLTDDPLQSGDTATVSLTLDKLHNNAFNPDVLNNPYYPFHGWYIKMNWAFPDESGIVAGDDSTAVSAATGSESTIVGEKVLAAPVMFNNEAYYTTYTPKVIDPNAADFDPCAVGNLGSSHLYHLSALTGESVFNYDILNDDDFTDPDLNERAKGADGVLTRSDRSRYLGEGIPSGIVTLIDASGRVTMMISSSNRVETYNAPDIKLISPVYWMQW